MKEMKMAIIAVLSFSLLIMGCPDGSNKNSEPPNSGSVDYTKLKLNEVSGVGDDTEKFYELINIGTKDIPLEDCTIYYNANSATGGTLPTGKGNLTWTGLSSQTIKAGGLFILQGRDTQLDPHPGSFTTGLTAGRILIITLEDPDGKVIDTCIRAADTRDYAITDKSFSRIPDGTGDFYFTTPTPDATNGTSIVGLKKVPAGPVETPPPSEKLMILQVFGMHANNDSAPTHSFIELYNNTNAAIPLDTYSVHWANGLSDNANAPAEKDVWHKINLTGSIPAKSSYLILGPQLVDAAEIANPSSTNGRLDLTTTKADLISSTFKMSNRSYKVALMSNQAVITKDNPWGDAVCIDLVSAINTAGTDSVTAAKGEDDLKAVNAASGGANTITKQKSWRRTSLTVSEVTLNDFTSKRYSTISTDDIEKFRPRNSAAGSYTPQF